MVELNSLHTLFQTKARNEALKKFVKDDKCMRLHISGLQGSAAALLLAGLPEYGTTTLNYWMYEQIVVGGSYNIPSAMGLVCTFFTIPFVVFGRWITNKIENIEY